MTKKLPSHAPLSILIVEDDPMTSQLATHHLKSFGSILKTSNAHEAVANYMVHRPDLVFVDIHYIHNVENGFDVLRDILSVDRKAFVVMVSGDNDPEIVAKSLDLGAQGFIAKPFKASDFSYYLNKHATNR